MKKTLTFFSIVVLTVLLGSCLENENSIRFTDYVDLSASALPDTVDVNTAIPVTLVATADNSCWHSIEFLHGVTKDTIVSYAAVGTFENHGEVCADVIVTKDTLMHFVPTMQKKYIFQFLVTADSIRVDTVVVR